MSISTHDAAHEGDFAKFKEAYEESKTLVIKKDEDERTCLHWAILGKNKQIIDLLFLDPNVLKHLEGK